MNTQTDDCPTEREHALAMAARPGPLPTRDTCDLCNAGWACVVHRAEWDWHKVLGVQS